jgi:glycosyltransferase involved in cell wall biosynthesis
MKILHLGKLCPPNEGGTEIFSFDLLEYLNRNGIKADLLCFGGGTKVDKYKGFQYFSCKTNVILNSAPMSYDYIKTFKKIAEHYDIIHVHSPNPLAEVLTLLIKKPIIIHWHLDIIKQKISYIFYRPIQQKVLANADRIIATSPQYLLTSKQLRNFQNKAVVIPLGLNPRRLISQDTYNIEFQKIKEKIGDKKIILSLGRLVKYKGFEYLIKAGEFIKDDAVILIAGGGPLYNSLNKLIKKLNLQNKVFLLGRVDDVSIFIKNCDLFCLPSIARNEAFGLVLVEALFFCKPLITTDVSGSGMNYVNINGKTGLVVQPRNPKALAGAINKVLSDDNLYTMFSKNASIRFKEFEIDSIGEKILKLYYDVLNNF